MEVLVYFALFLTHLTQVLEHLPCFVWEDCYDVISMIMQFVTAKKRSVILHVPN